MEKSGLNDKKTWFFEKMGKRAGEVVKKKDNLLILILSGILLMVIAWPVPETKEGVKEDSSYGLWSSGEKMNLFSQEGEAAKGAAEETQGAAEEYRQVQAEYLEKKLESILSAMYGAGKVRVMITLADTGEKIVEKDTPLERSNIAEKDSAGGSRSTNEMDSQETTVYVTNSQGEKIPYVTREKSPLVEGVTVVAEGGANPYIQKNISDSIQALFGIEAHKIVVVKMKQEG